MFGFEGALESTEKTGDDSEEGPPVPIPNTEVKLKCADDTCGLPCWENRLLLDFIYSPLAQSVERPAVKQVVRLKS